MKIARIRDVAAVAGVSTATVSRTLSQPEQVSEETRVRVMAAVKKTGYRINRSARNLRKQQSGEVLILVPNLGNPFFSEILAGIEETFSGSEYNVLIADSRDHRAGGRELLAEHLEHTRADGIIILDGGLSARARHWLRRQAAQDDRQVVFACEWAEGMELPIVRSNNRRGAALAIRYLHELGHTRIAHITGPQDNILTHARRIGVQEELQRLGPPLRPEWLIHGDFSLDAGYQAARQILAMPERPSAVFCASDQMAFGLMAALHAAGVPVPEQLSVLGFDDIELAEYYVP
ncbi:MAG: LacI family DNA-binding transcriptional regulator, partial [Thiolinea sp.]